MDDRFLQFWGAFLQQVGEGNRRFEDLARWMNTGFSGSSDVNELFRKIYGLDRNAAADPYGSKAWAQAARRFRNSFSEFLESFQLVPLARHEELRKEKEALEKQLEEQAKTIQELRLELGQSRMNEGKVVEGFRQLMEVQNEQYRRVSDSFQRLFKSSGGKGTPGEG